MKIRYILSIREKTVITELIIKHLYYNKIAPNQLNLKQIMDLRIKNKILLTILNTMKKKTYRELYK